MDSIKSIEDLQHLVVSGETNWKQYGEVYTKEHDNLVLFNYLPTAQFSEDWNFFESVSRGLIINRVTGEVVARPFDKFFNFGQNDRYTTSPIKRVYEKLDGSLAISFQHEGENVFSTRGGFTSDQAVWATNLWCERFQHVRIPREWTLLAEVIYPDNKIVVDYSGWSGLVVLAARNRFTGDYVDFDELAAWYKYEMEGDPHCRLVKEYKYSSTDEIIEECENAGIDFEGFVVDFEDGSKFKFKSKEYLRVHKLISNITEKNIHSYLMASDEELEQARSALPDEFLHEFDEKCDRIEETTANRLKKIYSAYIKRPSCDSQKDYALWVKQNPEWMQSFLFMMDKKDWANVCDRVLESYFKLNEKGAPHE